MPEVTVYVDEAPPSSNKNNGVGGRGHPASIARTKREWEGKFAMLLLAAGVPRGLREVRVTPTLQFRTRNQRDSDNFYFAVSKPLGDALVKGGWLADDTPAYYACERPRIEIGVTDLPPLAKGRTVLAISYEEAVNAAHS